MKRFGIVVILALTFSLVACEPVENTARDSIASAKGFIDSVASKHPECNQSTASAVCTTVTRANAIKHVAIDALEQYCAGPAFDAGTGPCQAPQSATMKQQLGDKLKAALRDLNSIIKDIKAIK